MQPLQTPLCPFGASELKPQHGSAPRSRRRVLNMDCVGDLEAAQIGPFETGPAQWLYGTFGCRVRADLLGDAFALTGSPPLVPSSLVVLVSQVWGQPLRRRSISATPLAGTRVSTLWAHLCHCNMAKMKTMAFTSWCGSESVFPRTGHC